MFILQAVFYCIAMRKYLSFVKFAHTLFALPFALVGYVIGLMMPGSTFSLRVLAAVLLCMVCARTAAMAFNRFADRRIDADNERTRRREIPTGVISASQALWLTLISAALFVFSAWLINPLCFALSPVALLVILGYSYTKRFTALSHFILGLGLSFAPVGAYIAVTESFDVLPILIGLMVLLWVGGFDIIYALQDKRFDKENALHSIPVLFGIRKAIVISALVHGACAVLCLYVALLLGVQFGQLEWLYWLGVGGFLVLLLYQHLIVTPKDLTRVNLAFFTTNGIASLIFGATLILDFYI
jgi:4-hydroxybenzoate polyprenyltransferase